jgi:hypothetical protein
VIQIKIKLDPIFLTTNLYSTKYRITEPTMKNFIKLKNKFIISDYSVQQLRVGYGKKDNDKFKGIWYSDVEYQNKDTIFDSIPARFRPYFAMRVMEVNTRIPPHTDSRIVSTINFYIKTDQCLTQFYKFKSENPTTTQVENQTDGFLFNVEDLKFKLLTGTPVRMGVNNIMGRIMRRGAVGCQIIVAGKIRGQRAKA